MIKKSFLFGTNSEAIIENINKMEDHFKNILDVCFSPSGQKPYWESKYTTPDKTNVIAVIPLRNFKNQHKLPQIVDR